MTEILFARTWIVIAAAFIASLNYLAVWVVFIGVRHWRNELRKFVRVTAKDPAPSLDTSILITSGVVMVIDVVILGGMNVGQFFELVTSNSDGIAWLSVTVLGPLIGGKAVTKFTSGKFGAIEAPPGTTSTSSTTSTTTTTGDP